MSIRSLLRSQIIRAWRWTLVEPYPQQLINSERGLQVHFCHRLMAEFADYERRLFVEPCFKAADGSVRSPDLVVCNSQRVIGVIELKYAPRGIPDFTKVLSTLWWFANEVNTITVANERYRGIGENSLKRYELAPDAVLCWGGVYAGAKLDVEGSAQSLGRRFLGLHAITTSGEKPTIYPDLEREE